MPTNSGVTLAVGAVYSPAAMAIHYEQLDEHVARITIDRPEARNSLDLYHFRDLAEAWRRFRDDPDAWVAIITGVAGNFMTGADLKTYIPQITALQQQIAAGEVDEIDGCRLRDGTDAVLRSLKIYKPIIAAVDGPCVAGGMEMLGGVDIRIATPRATFGVMEPKRGLFAGGGTTVRLPRQLAVPGGHGVPAHRRGVPGVAGAGARPAQRDRRPRRSWPTGPLEWAARITANAPLAVQATKESVLRGLAVDHERGLQDRGRARQDGSSPPRTPRRARRRSPRSASRGGRAREGATPARRASSASPSAPCGPARARRRSRSCCGRT